MKKAALLVLATVALMAAGCEPVPHYNRVAVASLTGQPTEVPSKKQGKVKPYGSVKLYEDASAVPNKYDVIAIMSVEGNPGDEARFITAFEYRAADLGADAIILHHGNTTPGMQWNGWFMSSNQQASYRAEAIRFKSGQ